MSEKLRPCPWCGTTPLYVEKYVYDNKWTQYRVGCERHDCDAQPTVDYHYFTEQEAIDAWNNQAVAVENESLKAENDKLREQMEWLVTLLRVDCDIDASWDGLRNFWSIGLTEDGCLMRDRACKAEAENAKLRELLADTYLEICAAYMAGRPLEPYQYDKALQDIGIEVDDGED